MVRDGGGVALNMDGNSLDPCTNDYRCEGCKIDEDFIHLRILNLLSPQEPSPRFAAGLTAYTLRTGITGLPSTGRLAFSSFHPHNPVYPLEF